MRRRGPADTFGVHCLGGTEKHLTARAEAASTVDRRRFVASCLRGEQCDEASSPGIGNAAPPPRSAPLPRSGRRGSQVTVQKKCLYPGSLGLDIQEHIHIMSARCQPRPSLPVFLPKPTKGLVRASSAGSAAPCAASSPAASLLPAASAAHLRRDPAATRPRRETRRRRQRPGASPPRAGRAPPHRFRHPGQPAPAGSHVGSAPTGAGPHRPPARRCPTATILPFTPEAYPGLGPEVCAVLNTPVEECDPELLRLVLAVFVRHIADSMPPELGLDAEALFSGLWGRLGAVPGEAGPDAPPAEEPPPTPLAPKDAEPDAPPAPPVTPLQPPGTAASDNAATAPIVARETAPDAASLIAPAYRRRRPLLGSSRSFRRCRRSDLRGGRPDALQRLPPQRRLCYAACAGPP